MSDTITYFVQTTRQDHHHTQTMSMTLAHVQQVQINLGLPISNRLTPSMSYSLVEWEFVLCNSHISANRVVYSYLSTSDLVKNVACISKRTKRIINTIPRCVFVRNFYNSYVNAFHKLPKMTKDKMIVLPRIGSNRQALCISTLPNCSSQFRCIAYTKRSKRQCKNTCGIKKRPDWRIRLRIRLCETHAIQTQMVVSNLPPFARSYGYLCCHHC